MIKLKNKKVLCILIENFTKFRDYDSYCFKSFEGKTVTTSYGFCKNYFIRNVKIHKSCTREIYKALFDEIITLKSLPINS